MIYHDHCLTLCLHWFTSRAHCFLTKSRAVFPFAYICLSAKKPVTTSIIYSRSRNTLASLLLVMIAADTHFPQSASGFRRQAMQLFQAHNRVERGSLVL